MSVHPSASRGAPARLSLLAASAPSAAAIAARVRAILASGWAVSVLLVAVLTPLVAYQAQPRWHLQLGGGYDLPFLNRYDLAYQDNWLGGFGQEVRFDTGSTVAASSDQEVGGLPAPAIAPAPNGPEPVRANYRWTRARPILWFPGVGAAARLELRAAASPAYAAGQHVQLLVNGHPLTAFDLHPGLPTLHAFDLGSGQDGSFAVEMRVTPSGPLDRHSKAPADGFKLYEVWITPAAAGLWLPIGATLALAWTALCLYGCLSYVALPRAAAGASTMLLLGLAGSLLVWNRLALTIDIGRLALILTVATLALPVLDWLLPRLARRVGLALPARARGVLLALFLIGLLLRGAGVLYPGTVVIDAPAHLVEIWRVTQGQWLQQYTNHRLSVAPGQWHTAILIPYSTISYFLLAPVALAPIDIHISANLFNVLLDAAQVFTVFLLGRALRLGTLAALAGASLYLLVPCTWLLNSWGNWPTTISLWLANLYLALTLQLYPRLGARRVWIGLTGLLTLAMLTYSVTAVFLVLLLALWGGGLLLGGARAGQGERRRALRLLTATASAVLLAITLYYWQFLPGLVSSLGIAGRTLGSGSGLGVPPLDAATYLARYLSRLFGEYGVGPLLVLGVAGYVWAARHPRHPALAAGAVPAAAPRGNEAARGLIGAWLIVFLAFSLVGWRLDMVDKQVWFVVPLACALAGHAVVTISARAAQPALRYGARLAAAGLTGWLLYSVSALWIYRIFIKRH